MRNNLKVYKVGPFVPSTSFTGGSEDGVCVHGENIWARFGKSGLVYGEGYTGTKDLNQPVVAFSLGTVSYTAGDKTVTGAGTTFLTDLRIGQHVYVNGGPAAGELFAVEEVIDDTTFLATEAPSTTSAGADAYIAPVCYAVGTKIGTSVSGNVIQFIKGHYLGVGQGEFKVNGQSLNAPFTLSKTPQLAMYDPVTDLYTIDDVGISLPGAAPHITVAAFTPGTATQMRAGSHSIRVVAVNTLTNGYSNPSDAIAPVVIVAGDQIQVTFNNAMAADQNAWDIFSSESNDSSTSNIEHRYQGPWYKVKRVTADDLIDGGHPTGREAGTVHRFSFQDGEITAVANLISFNNFPPEEAEYVDSVNGIPIYFSCSGKGNPSRTDGTSPGPAAIPSKPSNPEGAFLDKQLSMAQNDYIIGEMQFRSRIFCLGQMSLQVIILTTLEEEPIAFRSLWNVGFRNSYAADGFKEYIYGFSTAGMVRSVAGGDDSDIEFKFDSDVTTYVFNQDAGKVLCRYDPKNKAMVFFLTAKEHRNGYLVTIALPFLVNEGVFNFPIVLSKPDQDFVVSGVATVGQELIMVAGGRNSLNAVEFGTYVFDGGDSEQKDWAICWNYVDDGLEVNTKRVQGASVTGRLESGATMKVYTVAENGQFELDDFKSGVNDNGQIAFGATSGFLQRVEPVAGEMEPASLYGVRLEGSYTGSTSDTVDRLDQLVVFMSANSAEG